MQGDLGPITPVSRQAVSQLIPSIAEHDGIMPINESAALGIDGLRDAELLLARGGDGAEGFAVCDLRDEAIMLGVDPDHRRHGTGTWLLTEALAAHPGFTVWAFGTLPGAHALARAAGLVPARELLRMERSLERLPSRHHLPGYELTSYTPGDAEAVVAVNAEAFAHHPEQSRLTLEEFHQLTRLPWFDPAGLILAKHDGDLAGFHWTKPHGKTLGEVYVIAVAGRHSGRGVGRALLTAGLNHLAAMGKTTVQLYVEGSEKRVVRMYRTAGFVVTQTDTSFRFPGGLP